MPYIYLELGIKEMLYRFTSINFVRHVLVYIFKTDPACLDINKDLKCFVAEKDCLERFD